MIEGSYRSWDLYTTGQLVDGLQQKPVFIKGKWNHVVFSRATILSFHPVLFNPYLDVQEVSHFFQSYNNSKSKHNGATGIRTRLQRVHSPARSTLLPRGPHSILLYCLMARWECRLFQVDKVVVGHSSCWFYYLPKTCDSGQKRPEYEQDFISMSTLTFFAVKRVWKENKKIRRNTNALSIYGD